MLLVSLWLSLLPVQPSWQIGPFVKVDAANPVLSPQPQTVFHCPMRNASVHWEANHVFNPAAVVRNGKLYLLYRAEDMFGKGIGGHTSRIGLAESSDGLHFKRRSAPVLFPGEDSQKKWEWDGGCEDPRVVSTATGGYVLTYTQWNRKTARLAIATSKDLIHWKKFGPAFFRSRGGRFKTLWCKSGSIVTRRVGDRFVAAKVGDKYWMYWGDKNIHLATSTDLIHWDPVLNQRGEPIAVLMPRPGSFDSDLVEAGPPAVVTPRGILLLYNSKNSATEGDPNLKAETYAAGQALFSDKDPGQLLERTAAPFFKPERPYELTGQYVAGTVFIQGLASFKGKLFLYYGTADSHVAVAVMSGSK